MLILVLFANKNLFAQVSVYSFSQTTASYNTLAVGTTAYSGFWNDHTAGAAVQATIPFTFNFDGNPYTQCYISTNGFITFGSTQPSPTNYFPLSDNTVYNSSTTGGVISALGHDLKAGNGASTIKYGVEGSAPNRTFVIEWSDADRMLDIGSFDFQIRLSETTNVIALAYGLCQPQGTVVRTVQVGLRGPNSVFLEGNINNRLQGSSQTWLTNTISGPQNTSSIRTEIAAYPNSGLLYTFTPALPCATPTAQPSGLILGATSITDVSINGNSFTAASPAPTKYLVVRYPINVAPTAAIVLNRTYYPVGSLVGASTYRVVSASSSLTFTQTGLSPDTTYYYFVIPYNDLCTGGPFYNLTGIISGSATTCSRATTALTTTIIGGNDFVANWTTVAGASNYFIDVSTSPTFLTLVPGYSNLAVGNVTSLNITGLLPLTTYYFRVRALGIGCLVNSNVITTTTTCGYYTIPYFENFDALTTGVVPSCYNRVDGNSDGNRWQTQALNFSSASRSLQIDKNNTLDMNDWFFLPGLNLTAGVSYRLFFRYNTGTTSSTSENLKVQYGNNQTVAGMTVNLIDLPGINNSLFKFESVDFIPSSSGVFYIGFQGNSIANQTYIVVDDISVTLSPTCIEPEALITSAITATAATLSWTQAVPSPSLGYQYFLSTSNTSPITTTIPTGSVGPGVVTLNLTGLLPSTYYYVWVRGNCSAIDKSVWSLEESFNTECATPIISSTVPVTRCGFGTATITATPNITSTIYWYNAAIGGSLLGTGNSYTTPIISSNVTYYAEAKAYGAIEKVGPSSPVNQAGILAVQNYQSYVNFTVTTLTYLQSVDIYPLASGQPGRLALRNSTNATIALFPYTTAVSGGATLQQLLINYQLVPGDYNLFFETMPASGLRMNNSNAFYPYVSSVANITGNGTDFSFNLGLYNWKFTTECISPRVPVVVTVNAPPALSLSASTTTICDGATSPLITVTGYGAYNTLVWSPATGVSGTLAGGFTFNPTSTTTYTLIANQTSGSLCGNRITFTVIVFPAPSAITIIPNTASLCANVVQPLNGSTSASSPSTILFENFNAATNNWVSQNTSVGGDVTASEWTLRPNNYNYISPYWNVTFNSNDASQFYLTNSDSQSAIPGIITRTTLTSPSINLAGFTSANLNFWHYIRFTSFDTFLIRVSTDNGVTWNTIQTYTAIQGSATSFVNANVNLGAYLGATNVKIRFDFTSLWAYGWAIDNVNITGTLATALTWTPITGLFSDVAGTIPYVANTPLSVVYAKPPVTTTYTATLTGANGCIRTSTTTLNITPLSVGGTVSSDQFLCTGATPASITLAGQTGNVVRWEYADNAAFTVNVTPIVNSTTTLASGQMGVFPSIRYFRAVVKNGICNDAFSSVVFVSIPSTTWNGSAWSSGIPNANTKAIFNGNYSSSANLSACSVQVNSGIVVFNPNNSLIVTNEVVVAGGTLTFENNSSLVQINNTTNTGDIIYKRTTTLMKRFDYTYWCSPVYPQTLVGLSPNTPADKYYRFDQIINNWVNVPSNNIMDRARGYIIRAPYTFDNVTPSLYNGVFSGVPNNGTITIPIVVNLGNYNLIGNPYPSALNIDSFLSDPLNVGVVDATVYLWTHNTPITANQYTSNDYAAYNYLGGTGTSSAFNTGVNNTVPNGKIASGQSFFIRGLSNANVTFRNSMRIAGNNTQFFRMNDQTNATNTTTDIEKHRLWLDVNNSQGVYKQILLGYAETATNGFDRGFDGEFLDVGNAVAIYSLNNGSKYNIQGKALPFSIDDEVPIGFKGNISGSYQITLHDFDGLFLTQDVFIKDNFLNIIHNLKESNYSFLSEPGTFDNRFVIVYHGGTLNNPTTTFDENSIVIYKPNDKLIINSGNKTMKEVKIFDVRGRLIFEKQNINAAETSFDLGATNQVYVIQITTDDLIVVSRKYIN